MSTVTGSEKPLALEPRFEMFPDAIIVYPHWVTWRWELRPDKRGGELKWTKPPFNARTGAAASSTDRETWSTFEEAVAAYERGGVDGIGTALVPPLGGLDLDDVITPETGAIHPEALRIVNEINSYTERSPSGRGLRILFHGTLPPGWRNTREKYLFPVEAYVDGRYLTVTGHRLEGTPPNVEERTEQVAAFHARVEAVINAKTHTNGHRPAAPAGETIANDELLLARIRTSKNGTEFRRLFDRGIEDREDHSSADLALCSMLAFWTGRDALRMDQFFRRSALMREKWDERRGAQTYGELTIAKAIQGCAEVYTPREAREAVPSREVDPEVLRDETPEPWDNAPPAPYVRVVPPESFIAKYVAVAQRRTDAPPEAHELMAVGVLSALAGPRVRLPLAYRADGVRLVLWAMNVVNSTGGRKTVVNEFGVDVIRQVLGEEALLPWKGSPEAFVQALSARDGKAAVFARDEYTGLLASMKRGGYTAGLAQDFIRAYDGLPIVMARTAKMSRKTGQRVDDTDRVRDPYLVKLCAATWTSFIETATIEDVLDGLLARFVFTTGSAEEQRPRQMTPAIEDDWHRVVALARGYHERAADVLRVTIPEDVLDLSWDLEKRFKAIALAAPRPDAARPAMKRLAETVLKVSALLAIERASAGSAAIEPQDFAVAAALAERWQTTTLAVIADIGRTRFQARCDRVLATIRAHQKGITLSDLYRRHRDLGQREFEEVLGALETQRLAHRVIAKTGKRGPAPAVFFPGPSTTEGDRG